MPHHWSDFVTSSSSSADVDGIIARSTRPPRMPIATKTMPPFNGGQALRVVRIDGSETYGVVDYDNFRVWVDDAIVSSHLPGWRDLPTVEIPDVPPTVGRWQERFIGGLSKTLRLTGVVRSLKKFGSDVTLFAVKCTDLDGLVGDLDGLPCRVGEVIRGDEEHGDACEVVVHRAVDVHHVAAQIARSGGTPIFETPEVHDAHREIGVERLCRVMCSANQHDDDDPTCEEEYGLKRGFENWNLSWLPEKWPHVPITWDHVVDNIEVDAAFRSVESLKLLPNPLRQHVAKRRLERDVTFGTEWRETSPPTTIEWQRRFDDDPPFPCRRILVVPPERLVDALKNGRVLPVEVLEDFVPMARSMVEVDGTWWTPVDTGAKLKNLVSEKRWVSAALTSAQSKQIVTTFYLLYIERVPCADLQRALKLVLFHYAKERGYVCRWYSPYQQRANNVGNGDRFRVFTKMPQYEPHNLPSSVLNELCSKDGKLKVRGSKGSRAKRLRDGKKRYVPKTRIVRTAELEEEMRLCEND